MEKAQSQSASHTHRFTVRVWLEELGQGQTEWRESLAGWEQARARMFSNPELQEQAALGEGLILSGRTEYYTIEAEL